jgi:hypothetical protein
MAEEQLLASQKAKVLAVLTERDSPKPASRLSTTN